MSGGTAFFSLVQTFRQRFWLSDTYDTKSKMLVFLQGIDISVDSSSGVRPFSTLLTVGIGAL